MRNNEFISNRYGRDARANFHACDEIPIADSATRIVDLENVNVVWADLLAATVVATKTVATRANRLSPFFRSHLNWSKCSRFVMPAVNKMVIISYIHEIFKNELEIMQLINQKSTVYNISSARVCVLMPSIHLCSFSFRLSLRWCRFRIPSKRQRMFHFIHHNWISIHSILMKVWIKINRHSIKDETKIPNEQLLLESIQFHWTALIHHTTLLYLVVQYQFV